MKARTGSILIVVVLVLFLLTSLGISYVALRQQGGKLPAPGPVVGAEALENAHAGIAEVLARMSAPGSAAYIGQGPQGYRPGWGRYLVNGPGQAGLDPEYGATTSDGLDNDGDTEIDEAGEHYPETGSRQISLAAADRVDYPWAKVRYKLDGTNRIIFFGDHDDDPSTPARECLDRGVPKLIVTAAGRAGSGGWKVVTVEAVKWPPPPVPAALYVEGGLAFRDAAFGIDGRDHEEISPRDTVPGAAALPGVATPTEAHMMASQLTGEQAERIRGAGSEPSVRASSANLDLHAMADAWSRNADVTLEGGQRIPNLSAWGASGELRIVHVKGDLELTGTGSGAGVLIVDGDLAIRGTITWKGMILCLEDAKIQGGAGGVDIIGSVLVQGSLAGRSEVSGDVTIVYSSAVIDRIAAMTGYEVSSWIDQ